MFYQDYQEDEKSANVQYIQAFRKALKPSCIVYLNSLFFKLRLRYWQLGIGFTLGALLAKASAWACLCHFLPSKQIVPYLFVSWLTWNAW